MEVDVRKAKFFSYACILGGAVGSIWSYVSQTENPIGFGFLGFGLGFRIYTKFTMGKLLDRLRKEVEVYGVIET